MTKILLLLAILSLNCAMTFAQGFVGINNPLPTARLTIDNPNTTNALQINHLSSGRITRINNNRELYHEGDLWVHSAFGRLRFGYADQGWYFGTLNGGLDFQLWSHNTSDLPASSSLRLFIDGTTGNVGIGTSTPAEKLEVNNGFIRVSGTDKTAFKHTTAPANITANTSVITYASPSANDILIVTHNYSPASTYLNKSYGVYWNAGLSKWAVYLEDVSPMPTNIVFNVLVIKQ